MSPTKLSSVAVTVAIASVAMGQVGHSGEPDSTPQRAAQILDATTVKGGLIVHLGCGDGKMTAELRVNDSYIVHGLDPDKDEVEAARKTVLSKS